MIFGLLRMAARAGNGGRPAQRQMTARQARAKQVIAGAVARKAGRDALEALMAEYARKDGMS